MSSPSALVSICRIAFFPIGFFYGASKKEKLKEFVAEENYKKLNQLREVGLSHHSLRGATFHSPQIHDPWYSEAEIKIRERRPNYYLTPADEFAYQTKLEREKLEKLFQQKALIARSLAKSQQPGFHSFEPEEVMDIDPKQPVHPTSLL